LVTRNPSVKRGGVRPLETIQEYRKNLAAKRSNHIGRKSGDKSIDDQTISLVNLNSDE
jgi:hypothetical protein